MQNKYEHILLPVVALRGIVIFPGMTLHFDVSRKNAISALKNALAENKPVFLTCQKDPTEEDPAFPGLYAFGVAAEVRQVIRIQGSNNVRAVVEGRFRAAMRETASARPFMSAFIERCEEKPVKPSEAGYEKALIRESLALFEEYHSVSPRMASSEIKFTAAGVSAAGALSDSVSSVIPLPPDTKQKLLAELNPLKRLEKLSVILSEEIEIMLIEGDIRRKVQEQMEKNQKEYYLREQMKIISEEMGEDDYYDDEIDEYERKIKKSKMPDSNKEKLFEEVKKLEKIHPHSPENGGILTYLDTCLSLPWGKYTKDRLNLQNAKKTLERDHYGLEDVKERIIEMLAARAIAPGIKGQIICLAGPPGVGKTSVARSVAKAMGRKYERISLGGVRDEAEIRGHRRTYLGAIPGRIIHAVKSAKTANPLILLDEVDKLCGDFRGDPAAALLEALDGEQNVSFCDHYLEIPFDLSKVLFITTANDKYSIPAPLLDRMEVIELYSYTAEEKFNIAKKHLMPKQLKEHGLTKKNIKIADDAVREMIESYTREAGVRKLERCIAKLCRKASVKIADGDNSVTTVNPGDLEGLLGVRKYHKDSSIFAEEPGIVNGLAWTAAGGEILQVEAAILDGTGKIELTGSLGDVMKESAKAAISFIRSRAAKYGVDAEFYKNKDIHIHFPEGAVPKDGPSAGVTIVTALISALTNTPADNTVAMTGEISLRGRVMPIGGLREKAMAAYKAGVETVIIPYENLPDTAKIDAAVKEKISFAPVKLIDEALEISLPKPAETADDEIKTGGELQIMPSIANDEAVPVWAR